MGTPAVLAITWKSQHICCERPLNGDRLPKQVGLWIRQDKCSLAFESLTWEVIGNGGYYFGSERAHSPKYFLHIDAETKILHMNPHLFVSIHEDLQEVLLLWSEARNFGWTFFWADECPHDKDAPTDRDEVVRPESKSQ